jgi:hypothetical protein
MEEIGTLLHGGWRPSALLPLVSGIALAGLCFARLAVDPSGLIVDGRRPSVDYANRGDMRPVGNDLVYLFLPHHESIARRIVEFGHWPLWDGRGFGGRPLAGNPQAGMCYPPVWAVWRLRVPSGLCWLTVGHLLWGGLGVYVLVRSAAPSRWSATVAAGIYQASPFLLAHTFEGHYPHVWAACWYPWAFWAFRQQRSGLMLGRAVLPLILALTYLTGHPQEWFLLVLALSVWVLVDALRTWQSEIPGGRGAPVLSWIVALTLSVGMTAVEMIPQWATRPWLRRSHEAVVETGAPRRYHLNGLNGFQLLSPDALGGPADYFGDDNYWETVCSIGLVPLVLCTVAILRHPNRRLVLGWLVLLILSVWLACGRSLGLLGLAHATIPGMSWFRVPARSLFLANLAGAVLAGLGVETLLSRITSCRAWRKLTIRLTGLLLVLIAVLGFIQLGRAPGRFSSRPRDAALRWVDSRPGSPSQPEPVLAPRVPPGSGRTAQASTRILREGGFWLGSCGLTTLMLLGWLPPWPRNHRLAVSLIGLLALSELGWYGLRLLQVAPASRFLGLDPFGAVCLNGNRPTSPPAICLATSPQPCGEASHTTRLWRIKARDTFYGDLPAAFQGIEKTNVGDAFQLDQAAALYETLYPVASHRRPMAERLMSQAAKESWRRIRQAVFDRMSVAYLVSDRFESDPCWPVAVEGTWNGTHYVIQRNPTALPRAYVVPRATILPQHPGIILPAFCDLDPRRSVVMETDPLATLPCSQRQEFTAVEWRSLDPDRPALLVTTQAPGLLVVADTWMPGWSATVDGQPTPVLRGNYAQRVIPLHQPGRHTIVMEYHAPGFAIGCAITVASLLAWALIVWFRAGTGQTRGRSVGLGGPGPLHSTAVCEGIGREGQVKQQEPEFGPVAEGGEVRVEGQEAGVTEASGRGSVEGRHRAAEVPAGALTGT